MTFTGGTVTGNGGGTDVVRNPQYPATRGVTGTGRRQRSHTSTAAISRRSAAGDLSATDTQDLIAATPEGPAKLQNRIQVIGTSAAGLSGLGRLETIARSGVDAGIA